MVEALGKNLLTGTIDGLREEVSVAQVNLARDVRPGEPAELRATLQEWREQIQRLLRDR